MKDFLECTALITGASSGLGAEFARQLAPLAARLVLVARRADRLDALKAELLAANPDLVVDCRPADLTDPAQVEALGDFLYDGGVALGLVINNAAFGDSGTFETAEWAKIEGMIKLNVFSLTALCYRLIPLLRRHRPAAILNVSSVAALLPVPNLAVYAATKAYVSSLSESLRVELRGTGIGVTHLCPGPVDTEFGTVAARAAGYERKPMPDRFKVSPHDVVRSALLGVLDGRARAVPGLWMNVAVLGIALAPMWILRAVLNAQQVRERERTAGGVESLQPVAAKVD